MVTIIDNLKFYSTDEVAEILKLNKNTVCIFLREGKLKGIKVARKWFISEDSIKKLLNIKD